jgi:putative resolvase
MTPRARRALADADAEIQRVERLLISAEAVARRLGYTAATIRSWIHAGRIAYVKSPTGRYRIPESELDRLLQINPHVPQESQEPI